MDVLVYTPEEFEKLSQDREFFKQEVLMKGNFLLSQQNLPRRTHKLIELLALCSEIDYDFRGFEEQCLELDRYYLPTIYPDALIGTLPEGLPGRKEAESTLEIATVILEFVTDLPAETKFK